MKFAFVITRSDAIGGAHIHVRDVSSALIQLGHEVTVLAGGDGPAVAHFRDRGIPVRILEHMVRAISPLQDILGILELRRQFRELTPDLVSTHSSKAGWLGRIAARTLGLPVIFTAHGWAFADGVPPMKRALYRLAEWLAAPLAKRIITVSERDRTDALAFGIGRPKQVVAIHNAMPDVASGERARPGKQPPRIIMVARFQEPKDHGLLVEALADLAVLPWSLEMVGDGPLLAEVQSKVRGLGLERRVEFVGARDDVARRLAGAQIFTLVTRWEGFPRSILEGMRAALPVIASDVGGVREAVEHGVTGLVVPRGDVVALRDSLKMLIEDPAARIQYGAAGRSRFEKHFQFDRMFKATLGVYAQVASERR